MFKWHILRNFLITWFIVKHLITGTLYKKIYLKLFLFVSRQPKREVLKIFSLINRAKNSTWGNCVKLIKTLYDIKVILLHRITTLTLFTIFATSYAFNVNLNSEEGDHEFFGTILSHIPKVSLDISERNDTITSIGFSSDPQADPIRNLKFNYQKVHYLPHGLDHFFPYLEGLQVYESRLKAIHQIDMQQMPKLRFLHLAYNHIQTLDKDIFEFNPELEYINFRWNRLAVIEDILNQLPKLSYAYFDQNLCMDNDAETRDQFKVLVNIIRDNCALGVYGSKWHKFYESYQMRWNVIWDERKIE